MSSWFAMNLGWKPNSEVKGLLNDKSFVLIVQGVGRGPTLSDIRTLYVAAPPVNTVDCTVQCSCSKQEQRTL